LREKSTKLTDIKKSRIKNKSFVHNFVQEYEIVIAENGTVIFIDLPEDFLEIIKELRQQC
jgi:RIO-like serine/threonine protein kinase